MSISISNAVSIPPSESANSSSNPATPKTQQARPTANQPADTVRLSESQQVHQLFLQGQRVSQIAFSLRLTVETVNGYLGITGKSG